MWPVAQGSQGDFVQEFNMEANVACPSPVRRPPELPVTTAKPSPFLQDCQAGRIGDPRPDDGMVRTPYYVPTGCVLAQLPNGA